MIHWGIPFSSIREEYAKLYRCKGFIKAEVVSPLDLLERALLDEHGNDADGKTGASAWTAGYCGKQHS